MKNNFDFIARFYDGLADLVFGKMWEHVQLAPVRNLKPDAKVLIAGGGTGRILPCLQRTHQVVFLELSETMMKLAKERESDANITFIQDDYLEWRTDESFDAVIFPFFLDSFHASNLKKILAKAKDLLASGGQLHVVDFQKGKAFQQLIVWLMYRFFNITARLEARRLNNIHQFIMESGYDMDFEESYLGSWIFYRMYTI